MVLYCINIFIPCRPVNVVNRSHSPHLFFSLFKHPFDRPLDGGNAFVSRVGSQRFKFRAGQIGRRRSVANGCNISSKEAVLLRQFVARFSAIQRV